MSVSPFFRVIGFMLEPPSHNHDGKKGRLQAALVVLPSDEAQRDVKFNDIFQIGFRHLWWYVATVYAIKLRNDIFLATRTIHSFIPFLTFEVLSEFPVFIAGLSKSRLCARPFGLEKHWIPSEFS
jgi:hypothetical protein